MVIYTCAKHNVETVESQLPYPSPLCSEWKKCDLSAGTLHV